MANENIFRTYPLPWVVESLGNIRAANGEVLRLKGATARLMETKGKESWHRSGPGDMARLFVELVTEHCENPPELEVTEEEPKPSGKCKDC